MKKLGTMSLIKLVIEKMWVNITDMLKNAIDRVGIMSLIRFGTLTEISWDKVVNKSKDHIIVKSGANVIEKS